MEKVWWRAVEDSIIWSLMERNRALSGYQGLSPTDILRSKAADDQVGEHPGA
jgi:hypothetical protein